MAITPQVHLLFGFLGAGKTTLVRNLLEDLDPQIPTAVVVNEFGQVGIDGEIIQGKSVDTIELVSGCICCTLRGSLLNALEELNDKGVQRIVVEATGVADPEDMLDDLEEPAVVDKFDVAPIVTVVDSANFNKIRTLLGDFYVSQVLNADIVILNKIDLAVNGTLEEVANEIKEINPEAEVRFAEHCDVDSSLIFSNEAKQTTTDAQPRAPHSHHHHHDSMESCVVEPFDHLCRADLEHVMQNMPQKVWRIKGHMLVDGKASLVQYSAGSLDVSDCPQREHYRMVVIGQELDSGHVASRIGHPIV